MYTYEYPYISYVQQKKKIQSQWGRVGRGKIWGKKDVTGLAGSPKTKGVGTPADMASMLCTMCFKLE